MVAYTKHIFLILLSSDGNIFYDMGFNKELLFSGNIHYFKNLANILHILEGIISHYWVINRPDVAGAVL